jgi:cell division septum initiation protein DivIVA
MAFIIIATLIIGTIVIGLVADILPDRAGPLIMSTPPPAELPAPNLQAQSIIAAAQAEADAIIAEAEAKAQSIIADAQSKRDPSKTAKRSTHEKITGNVYAHEDIYHIDRECESMSGAIPSVLKVENAQKRRMTPCATCTKVRP